MTVYVDNARIAFGNMRMCHMLADTREELFAMASKIGVQLKWYQGFEKASCPHFDIASTKRDSALANGAVPIKRHDLGTLAKKIRADALQKTRAGKPHGWEPPQ